MERNQRKTLVGRVVSDKMDKTITVVVETKRNHPVYGKRINYSKKYKAHDENNVAKEGDIVRIMETRPLSATKPLPSCRGCGRSCYYLIKLKGDN